MRSPLLFPLILLPASITAFFHPANIAPGRNPIDSAGTFTPASADSHLRLSLRSLNNPSDLQPNAFTNTEPLLHVRELPSGPPRDFLNRRRSKSPLAVQRAGSQGKAAAEGRAGAAGILGAAGLAGAAGIEGAKGGISGKSGVAGRRGKAGSVGREGAAGQAGKPGIAGAAGKAGVPGKAGVSGKAGAPGGGGGRRAGGGNNGYRV